MIYSTKIIDFIKNDLNNDSSLFNETPFYQGDPEVKKGNLLFDLTEEELATIATIKEDIVRFANEYCYVNTFDGTRQIKLHKYQEEYLIAQKKYRFLVTIASRQTGKTIMESIYGMNRVLEGKQILIVTNVRDSGIEVLDKIKTIYRRLPFYMKPGVLSWNQTSVLFDNGSSIQVKIASKFGGITKPFDVVFIDEAAHIPYAAFNDVYNLAFNQMLQDNGQLIMSSTPNGYNRFHSIYQGAKDGKNIFVPHRIDWWEVPGRDEEWKKREIQNMGSEEMFDREYGLSFGKVPTEEEIEKEKEKEELLKKAKEGVKTEYINPTETKTASTLEDIVKRLEGIEKLLEIKYMGEPLFARKSS